MEKTGCKHNYSNFEIEKYFGESEESMEICSSCPHYHYRGGLMTCDKINKEGQTK